MAGGRDPAFLEERERGFVCLSLHASRVVWLRVGVRRIRAVIQPDNCAWPRFPGKRGGIKGGVEGKKGDPRVVLPDLTVVLLSRRGL